MYYVGDKRTTVLIIIIIIIIIIIHIYFVRVYVARLNENVPLFRFD